MFDIGVQELIVILLIAVFFFGGEKIPEIAKGLGCAVTANNTLLVTRIGFGGDLIGQAPNLRPKG